MFFDISLVEVCGCAIESGLHVTFVHLQQGGCFTLFFLNLGLQWRRHAYTCSCCGETIHRGMQILSVINNMTPLVPRLSQTLLRRP